MTPRHPPIHSCGSRRAFLGGMLAAGGAAAWPGAAGAQAFDFKPNQRYPDPAVQVLDPSFAKYSLFNSTVEQVATGLRWAEGPVWFGDGRYLLVSDIPNNRIVRRDEATGQLGVFRQPSNFSNGLARDRQGRLLACEHLTRRITRTEYDGGITVLADGYGGKRFNSPNDIVFRTMAPSGSPTRPSVSRATGKGARRREAARWTESSAMRMATSGAAGAATVRREPTPPTWTG